jgi:putrescine transport system permease protein
MRFVAKFKLLQRDWVSWVPTFWLGIFFLIPFLVVLKISLSQATIAMPPYLPIFEWVQGTLLEIRLDFANYLFLIDDPLYGAAYFESIRIAFISTIITLLIGYPMAYVIATAKEPRRTLLLLLVILPFWTSFLLRVYAWIAILKTNGLLNGLLQSIGLIPEPLVILQTDLAVYIGIPYTYLPFMVLPLYASLSKLDQTLIEASEDLGATPWISFLTVTLPLTIPGVIAGSLLVFVPAIGEFVIPALLGGNDTLMIGKVLWNEFFANRDWPIASAVAIIMLFVIVGPLMWLNRINSKTEEAAS